MKYEIKGDSTQVTYEAGDQPRKPPREQNEFGGETIICLDKGMCHSIAWTPKEGKISK